MKTKPIVLALALGLLAVTVCSASPQLGKWKLNEAKSKLAPGTRTNQTVVYETVGDMVKITVEGTDAAGKPMRDEWTGKFDGQDYAVTGDPSSDARSYTEIDANTLEFAVKKDGKALATGKVVVSADGMSRTVTVNGTDAQGKPYTSVSVYDKQ